MKPPEKTWPWGEIKIGQEKININTFYFKMKDFSYNYGVCSNSSHLK